MIFSPSCITSAMVNNETNAEFLINAINSLPNAGIIRTNAWGRMTLRIAILYGKPSERAASIWPFSTD
ncbi:hypothetical protein D3C72_2444710 [compost metagenome]